MKFPRHPHITETSEFRGKTTTLRDAAGAEGGVGIIVSTSNSVSSKKVRSSPQLSVEGSISVSLVSGKLVARSMMKPAMLIIDILNLRNYFLVK